MRWNSGARRVLSGGALLAGALVLCAGCAAPAPQTAADAGRIELPPASGTPDYQLGGAYAPAEAVDIVARDRTADPDPDRYSICYVNGFQTQPGERALWPDATLLQRGGAPVIDPEWPDEIILDTSTTEARGRILEIVGPWIRGCSASGFDAVEFDNLDTYTRSEGALAREDNIALATAYVEIAHEAGLAAAQKNSAEDAELLRSTAGFDFAIAEECAAYAECGAYTDVYGEHVIDVEYDDALPRTFAEMCADGATPASVVLRDRQLALPGDPAHRFETCS
ncbi:endo alpha-1,4 polygalactosaminidase [Leucobacter chromiiresistens]|uniref:Glycoside-hydrolase family GH114 TIM-barrel domain-containing protein n=1 Tax=Leucobacter chromiiresistens TaxID=1079994 RepID=A0A1H0YCY8_9MICO|nr:endo alpha-1,4 polygalactosaminidase [Leucobacter chromiiresistens]SDQ12943.1 hypothetical protein SAMN04488565_0753 [Leucobacter chromiiresistens]